MVCRRKQIRQRLEQAFEVRVGVQYSLRTTGAAV